jgi:hypothetical protein
MAINLQGLVDLEAKSSKKVFPVPCSYASTLYHDGRITGISDEKFGSSVADTYVSAHISGDTNYRRRYGSIIAAIFSFYLNEMLGLVCRILMFKIF